MTKTIIRYIINPHSGAKEKAGLPDLIRERTDASGTDVEITISRAPGHATELAAEAARTGFDLVVAVGGDGSVNETAAGLKGTATALGIIPKGSGNGMARHLNIPLAEDKAIDVINRGYREKIDTLTVNDHFCIGTIGVGFDAHIAHLFAASKVRGYSTYVKLVLTEFYKYKPKTFTIRVDDRTLKKECFLLTFANSSQFGNNAVIAPFADVQDGIVDVSMMKKFPVFVAPHLIYRLMNNIIHKSRFFERDRGTSIRVDNAGSLQGHIDGEPVTFRGDLNIQVVPASLTVIVPKRL